MEQPNTMVAEHAQADMRSLLGRLLALSPHAEFCGFQIVDVDERAGALSVAMEIREDLERVRGSGQFHGGPIASLIDTAACLAAAMRTSSPPPTISMHVNFVRGAVGPRIVATAQVRRAGRSVAFVDVDVEDGNGQLVATGSANFALPNDG
jgi:uncharacterized protein (TIGR00369 family)